VTHTLYAYVDGSDLDDVETLLLGEFQTFARGRSWSRSTWVVNQRQPSTSPEKYGDLPNWDLGLNHELPDPGDEVPGWFEEVEAIALFLGALAEKSGREFVIGIRDNGTGSADDLFFVGGLHVDVARLRAIVGVGPIA